MSTKSTKIKPKQRSPRARSVSSCPSPRRRLPTAIRASAAEARRISSEIAHDHWERAMAQARHATRVVVDYDDGRIDLQIGCLCGWQLADESLPDRAVAEHMRRSVAPVATVATADLGYRS